MRREVKVKICGITRRIDAVYAAELGAYAIGFILVPQTIRRVEIDEINRLIYGLKNIIKVGVVANQSLNEIISLFKSSP
jgi:phosphoribosylanthranilate isomerase